jgi:sphinganine-1-phosphate aldolase
VKPEGVPADQVLAELASLRERDLPTHGGRLFAYVYDPGLPGLDELTLAAHGAAASTNGLDPTAFPSLLAMENDIVAAAASLLGGELTAVGNVTSGGTESVLLAVKAARDARPDIASPRLVMPSTAHPAFAKAGSYLRVAVDAVPVDPVTLRVPAADMAAAIGPDTVLVVASAPSYPHGIVDPVEEIASAAAARDVRCHVDACFGGWVLPFFRRLGVDVPSFDFDVAGVTSISVDLHKYAYCPKGVSVLLHRSPALREAQYFGYAEWSGYGLVNATAASTRPGGPIAAAWATLRHIGESGYLSLAERTLEAVRGLAAAVSSCDGVALVMDPPESPVVAFRAADPGVSLFAVCDELARRGWHVQPQMSFGGVGPTVHLTVTAAVAPRVGEFGPALDAAVTAARTRGPVAHPPEILEALRSLDPASLTLSVVADLAALAGLDLSGEWPTGSTAAVNTLLDAAPPPVRTRLLIAVLDLMQRPRWQ